MTEIAIVVLIGAVALIVTSILRRRKQARNAVTAECLVCSHRDTQQGFTAAHSAGMDHHEATGHPVILVGSGSWARNG